MILSTLRAITARPFTSASKGVKEGIPSVSLESVALPQRRLRRKWPEFLDSLVSCPANNLTSHALTVILSEVSSANEVAGSRTASRLGVKPAPVSASAKRSTSGKIFTGHHTNSAVAALGRLVGG